MNRDIIITPITNSTSLVTAVDCSGSVGSLHLDTVPASYHTLAYYTARVAFMEVMSVGAKPYFYTVSNFIPNEYEAIHKGINDLLCELNLADIQHITSSETNFEMKQSALGISVTGLLDGPLNNDSSDLSFACIGSPLVGGEVINQSDQVISAKIFADLAKDKKAIQIVPVGSKGIACKLNKVFNIDVQSSDIDVYKSAGPSTCVLLGYKQIDQDYFKSMLKDLFHPLIKKSIP